MNERDQKRFDLLLEDVIESLPGRVRAMLDEVPVIVMDRPSEEMVAQLRRDGLLDAGEDGSDLCGLHTGVGLTERSVEDPGGWGGFQDGGERECIHLFREGIVSLALEVDDGDDGGERCAVNGAALMWDSVAQEEAVYEEVRITLLHEIGHHFGLDEGHLDDLGYA